MVIWRKSTHKFNWVKWFKQSTSKIRKLNKIAELPCLPLNYSLFSRIALRKGVFIFGLVAALSHLNNVPTVFVAKLCFSKLSSTGACSRLIPAKLSRFGLFLTKYNVFVFLLLNYVFFSFMTEKRCNKAFVAKFMPFSALSYWRLFPASMQLNYVSFR